MNAQQEIKDAQAKWARSKQDPIPLYTPDVKSNLFQGRLSSQAWHGYEGGDGHELDGNMRALHSSSALVVNFFDYWTERDKAPLLSALGENDDSAVSLDFERKFHTEISKRYGNPPNLDIAVTLDSDHVIAIESKFTEWMSKKTKVASGFADKYFRSSPLWTEQGLPECQSLAKELHEGPRQFSFLDTPQLLKHALGLATQLGDQFSLYYLYYDWPGERSEAHKEEIERFAERAGEELGFKALTYQKVYKRLRDSEQAEPGYLTYLGDRYFSDERAGVTS